MSDEDKYVNVNDLIQNKDIEGLCSALYSNNFKVRKESAIALKDFAEPETEEVLIDSLKYEKWQKEYDILGDVRANCAEALGKIGKLTSVEPLIEALDDPDFEVNAKSAESLGKIGDPSAIDMLIHSLSNQHPEVRCAAVKSLGEIGDESAIEPIIKLLNKDQLCHVRVHAIIALNKFNDLKILEPLVEALNDEDTDVQRHAINGLIKLEDYALTPLLKKLKDEKWQLRAISAETLGKIGNPLAEPYLKALLIKPTADKNPYVRGKVAEALGEIGEESSIPILHEALKDKYFIVRNKALEALELIGLMDELCRYETVDLRFDFPCKLKIKEIYENGKIVVAYLPETNLKMSFNIIEDSSDIKVLDFINVMKEVFEKRGLRHIYKREDKISRKRAVIIQGCDPENDKMVKVIAFKHDDSLYYVRISLNMSIEDELIKYLKIMQNSFTII